MEETDDQTDVVHADPGHRWVAVVLDGYFQDVLMASANVEGPIGDGAREAPLILFGAAS